MMRVKKSRIARVTKKGGTAMGSKKASRMLVAGKGKRAKRSKAPRAVSR